MNELVYSNIGLVPYNPTWLTNFLEQSWREQRGKRNNYDEDSGSITLQKLLFQLYGQHMLVTALWEEERKNLKKFIVSQGEEIIDLKEKLENQKKRMDHALKLDDQALVCRLPS